MTTNDTHAHGGAWAPRPRMSGLYATWRGIPYFARLVRGSVYIYTRETPLPAGFKISVLSWFTGQRRLAGNEIDRLVRLESHCRLRNEPFEITNIVGDIAYVRYLGRNVVNVALWANMEQTDKYEVQGEAPIPDLADLEEVETDVPLPGPE